MAWLPCSCCMKGEKVSTPLDKDGRGPCGLCNTHMVKALPLTSWHLTSFAAESRTAASSPNAAFLPFATSTRAALWLFLSSSQQAPSYSDVAKHLRSQLGCLPGTSHRAPHSCFSGKLSRVGPCEALDGRLPRDPRAAGQSDQLPETRTLKGNHCQPTLGASVNAWQLNGTWGFLFTLSLNSHFLNQRIRKTALELF